MKKKIVYIVLLVFIFIPFNFSQAVTQNQINAEVQIVCPDSYGNWFSGSGTIIDSKGIILTNKHVVSDEKGSIIKTCFIGFIESVNQEPNFGSQENPNLAEVKYYTTKDDMDSAILYLDNPLNKIYPYVNIWDSNSSNLKFGDRLEVIGFPSIGGSTITYTSGDFSGFGGLSDGTINYVKTSAPLEHGNSGGASYNTTGQFIGIPTMVVAGTLNSLSYILSINSIKTWLFDTLGNKYKNEVKLQEPVIEKPLVTIQNNVTPPVFDTSKKLCYAVPFKYSNVDEIGLGGRCFPPKLGQKEEFNHIQFYISQSFLTNLNLNQLKKVYYYFDKKPHGEIDSNALQYEPKQIFSDYEASITDWIDVKTPGKYFLSFFGVDDYGNISNPYIYEYVYAPKIDTEFVNKLKGKILLQTESKGEAWYVNPKDGVRYYMANGDKAYNVMRNFGVGITNKDLEKVKINKTFAKKNSGKIFLQVESKGEAYYVDFSGITHYLKDGIAAYEVMRSLGLGITNANLNKIFEGSL